MRVVKVGTGEPYEVLIARDFLDGAGQLLRSQAEPCRICLVTDDVVGPLYAERVERSLAGAGFAVCTFTFPNGEQSKNLDTYARLLSFLAVQGLSRSDLLVALGGGVVGDLAGFAAATYLRGVRYVQLPTTLLAAVDSSVGGKTAVDLPEGKNLAGAFWQPSLVLCDVDTLQTLPEEQVRCGLAEALKYGVLCDGALFETLSCGGYDLEAVVARCVEIKAEIVAQDERDAGRRQLLNLGHTIGHAVEQCSGFKTLHGQAVAIGMAAVTRAAQSLGIARPGTLEQLLKAYETLGLPAHCADGAPSLAAAAFRDKKRAGSEITLVVPRRIGDCMLYKLQTDMLEGFIEIGLG